jgi:hypothetical protein
LSGDFSNFRDASGNRPIYTVSTAGDLVRFSTTSLDPNNPSVITRIFEFGVPISVVSVNSFTGSNTASPLTVALAALNSLRPDPTRTQVEQLASIGNSFYHGLTVDLRHRFKQRKSGASASFRVAYTLSRLVDDGIVNTSSALTVGDFRAERSLSLQDRRHRLALSGIFDMPRNLGGLSFSPIFRIGSGAPFNISSGGVDRNLDDVDNDRPNYSGDLSLLHYRKPGSALDPAILAAFFLPSIGGTGNLPRNAGRGPGNFTFDLNIIREFRIGEHKRLRPTLELDNILNKTVFSFGSEFVNFDALSPTATEKNRQDFVNSFLVPTHTLRPRQLKFGIRFDF